MTIPGSERDDVVVIGGRVGSSDVQVFPGIKSVEQAVEIAKRESALAADELRIAEEKIGVIRREIVTDPTRVVDAYLLERSRCHVTELLDQELAELPGKEQIRLVDEYHRYSTLGSVLLFSGTELDGSSKFVPVPWAKLKWWPFNFNDKPRRWRAGGLSTSSSSTTGTAESASTRSGRTYRSKTSVARGSTSTT